MAEITRLSGCSEWLELDVVERERTPRRLMELCIRLHLAGLSLSNTVKELETFGARATWCQSVSFSNSACTSVIPTSPPPVKSNALGYAAAVSRLANSVCTSKMSNVPSPSTSS